MQHKVIIAQNNALVFLSCLTKEKKTEMALIPLLLTSKKSMIWHSKISPSKRKTDIKKHITSANERDKAQIRMSKRHRPRRYSNESSLVYFRQ